MTFMFAMGLAVTAMIRIGNQKGKKDYLSLQRIAYSIFLLIFIFDIFFCLFFLIGNEILPLIYLDISNPLQFSDVSEVIKIASSLLMISAFFKFLMDYKQLF